MHSYKGRLLRQVLIEEIFDSYLKNKGTNPLQHPPTVARIALTLTPTTARDRI